jgi:hypothetical protein
MKNVFGMALVALALTGCVEDEVGNEPEGINNGRMIAQLTDTVEREVHMRWVLSVAVPEELTDNLNGSLDYWENEFDVAVFVPAEEEEEPDINTEFGQLGGWGRANWQGMAEYPDWTPYVTGGTIIIDPKILWSESCVTAVLTHELGHMLGLRDDTDTDHIMDGNIWCGLAPMLESDHNLIQEDIEAM